MTNYLPGEFPVYDTEDAILFVLGRLALRGVTDDDIRYVLDLEDDYNKSIGLYAPIDSPVKSDPPVEVDPAPYILANNDRELAEEVIHEVLAAELDYMISVGIAIIRDDN